MFRIREIMELLPHRYPFLLVDRIVEWDPGKRIVAQAMHRAVFSLPMRFPPAA